MKPDIRPDIDFADVYVLLEDSYICKGSTNLESKNITQMNKCVLIGMYFYGLFEKLHT